MYLLILGSFFAASQILKNKLDSGYAHTTYHTLVLCVCLKSGLVRQAEEKLWWYGYKPPHLELCRVPPVNIVSAVYNFPCRCNKHWRCD